MIAAALDHASRGGGAAEMFLPRLGRLRNNRNAWWQSLGKIGLVNYPSRVVNCSSKSGELCKRIETGFSVK